MTIKQINQLIEEGESLKLIAEAYTEIASSKLKKIRSDVERNRQFFNNISGVYRTVTQIAASQGVTIPSKNGKRISVLITSNYRFYGNINNQLIKFFIDKTSTYQGDKVIIGKTAQDYLRTINYVSPHTKVVFKSDNPTLEELQGFIESIKSYSQILVYYPQMKSVMVQNPTIKDITEFQPVKMIQKESHSIKNRIIQPFIGDSGNSSTKNPFSSALVNGAQIDFILEPEIKKMLEFFDRQFSILLLEQTFLESELARTASRLISMDEAQSNAKDFIRDNRRVRGQIRRAISNGRLLESISTLANFRKSHYAN